MTRLINGKTFVPLRAVSEETGASAVWNEAVRSISVATGKWRGEAAIIPKGTWLYGDGAIDGRHVLEKLDGLRIITEIGDSIQADFCKNSIAYVERASIIYIIRFSQRKREVNE